MTVTVSFLGGSGGRSPAVFTDERAIRGPLRYAILDSLILYDLSDAHLEHASLRRADMTRAHFYNTYLYGCDLRGAILPAPAIMLQASWGDELSPQLVRDLMRWDAANHPRPEAFARWAKTGRCPYTLVKVRRAAHFQEDRKLYKPGPCPRPYDLLMRLFKAQKIRR